MSGLGGIIHWDGRPVDASLIQHMMDLVKHRGPDGIGCQAGGKIGLGHALLAMRKQEIGQRQPLWLPDRSCAIVADAQIHNRADMLARLGPVSWFQDQPSDAAILLAAYERWNEAFLQWLDGDYAFAIWDNRRQQLFAARDPFAARPLFFRREKDRFLFASEPKQLLCMPGVPVEVDDLIVAEYLFDKWQELDRTFFKGIERLIPGYYLLATADSVVQRRWWNPDPEYEIHYPDSQDYFDRFRELLTAAVAKRLQTDYPAGAQLSGGFDSSSVVVLAAELYRNGNDNLPPLETISAVYPGLPCDETPYIESVIKRVPFQAHTFNPHDQPFEMTGFDKALWRADSPYGGNILRGFNDTNAKILSGLGARSLLDGAGGDEVVHEGFYLQDLALRRRYLTLLREAWVASKTSWNSFPWLMFHALLPTIPDSLKWPYRRIRKPGVWQPPDWAAPSFVDFYLTSPDAEGVTIPEFSSRTHKLVFRDMNDPLMYWGHERLEAQGSYHGYEHFHPYCDRPLVEYVLAIPFEQRISGGQWRYLQRRGLAAQLPQEILDRQRKTIFNASTARLFADARDHLEGALFSEDAWLSAPYVRRREAQLLFKHFDLRDDGANIAAAVPLWRIAFLELWLRQLDRYDSSKILDSPTTVLISQEDQRRPFGAVQSII